MVQIELKAQVEDQSLWKYREVREKDGKRELLEIIETRRGAIERLLGINGHALSPNERANEDHRIDKLLADPDQFEQKQKSRNEDAEKSRNLLKMLPAAFRYHYDGTQGNLVKLTFSSNPSFHPAGRESEVFRHMEGTMWVDPHQKTASGARRLHDERSEVYGWFAWTFGQRGQDFPAAEGRGIRTLGDNSAACPDERQGGAFQDHRRSRKGRVYRLPAGSEQHHPRESR
jgi:hypothetical protein